MTNEHKALEEAAYGKLITFHTKHHWILTWIQEQPGRSLRAKVWGVIDRAYRADYAKRGQEAMRRYWDALGPGDYPNLNYSAIVAALCDACECFGRAGLRDDEERARDCLRGAMAAQAKYDAAKVAA
jgi:hypothetical protein